MSEDIKPKPKMSIEQAGNYLAEKKETMAAEIKKEAKKQAISYATPDDRKAFLMYGISLMDDISEAAKNEWCRICNKTPALFTTKEVCLNLKKLLCLRINNCSINSIAHHLRVSPVEIVKSEALAIKVVGEAIECHKLNRLPLIGK